MLENDSAAAAGRAQARQPRAHGVRASVADEHVEVAIQGPRGLDFYSLGLNLSASTVVGTVKPIEPWRVCQQTSSDPANGRPWSALRVSEGPSLDESVIYSSLRISLHRIARDARVPCALAPTACGNPHRLSDTGSPTSTFSKALSIQQQLSSVLSITVELAALRQSERSVRPFTRPLRLAPRVRAHSRVPTQWEASPSQTVILTPPPSATSPPRFSPPLPLLCARLTHWS